MAELPPRTTPPVRTGTLVPAKRPLTVGRVVMYAVAAALVAAFVGYLFGWYRAYPAEQDRDRTMVRLRLSEARVRALDGSVAIYRTNWGDAAAHFQEGVRLLEAFGSSDQQRLSQNHAQQVDEARTLLGEARDLAAQTNLDANSRAQRAAALLGEVYRGMPESSGPR